jgi:hypothetical protein
MAAPGQFKNEPMAESGIPITITIVNSLLAIHRSSSLKNVPSVFRPCKNAKKLFQLVRLFRASFCIGRDPNISPSGRIFVNMVRNIPLLHTASEENKRDRS